MHTVVAQLLALVIISSSAAIAPATEPPAAITVTGRGEHAGAPDLAVISFAVETTAPQAGAAMDENARKSQALGTALKAVLESEDQLSTSGFALDPVYDHHRERPHNEPPSITGYVARNEVRVETVKTGEVGRLIDVASKAGANRISGLHFTLRDQKEARARALEKAVEDAAQQANSIASALGVRLGRVLSATTTAIDTPPPRPYYGAAMAMEARVATPIEAGDVRVESTVHVTYAIE